MSRDARDTNIPIALVTQGKDIISTTHVLLYNLSSSFKCKPYHRCPPFTQPVTLDATYHVLTLAESQASP